MQKALEECLRGKPLTFVIIDTDADLVRDMQKQGINAVYGEANYRSVLEEASVKDASSMLLYVEGTSHKASIIKAAKELNPQLHIVVRTRYIDDLEFLYEMGADDVIPIEFEAYLEMFSRALNHYLVPNEEIEGLLAKIRANGYKAFRSNGEKGKKEQLNIPDFEINTMVIHKNSVAYQKSIKDLTAKGEKLWDPEEKKEPKTTAPKSKKPKNSVQYENLWPPKPVAMRPADRAKTKK